LTTNFFAIDPSGVLVVNEENLDRDPPSPGRFRFQVVAREKTGVAASSPLSFIVTLNDVNDNAPLLPMMAPITVQAGETKRQVAKVLLLFLESLGFLIISSYVSNTSSSSSGGGGDDGGGGGSSSSSSSLDRIRSISYYWLPIQEGKRLMNFGFA